MRKLKQGRKLSREKDQRKALLKSLARAIFIHKKIKTTEAKAKEVSMFAEKCITRAKKGDLSSRRILVKYFSKDLVKKLVTALKASISPKSLQVVKDNKSKVISNPSIRETYNTLISETATEVYNETDNSNSQATAVELTTQLENSQEGVDYEGLYLEGENEVVLTAVVTGTRQNTHSAACS